MLVVDERIAESVCHFGACFACDQCRGANIPFKAPAKRRDEISLVSRDHGDTQRDRIGLVDHAQDLVFIAPIRRWARVRQRTLSAFDALRRLPLRHAPCPATEIHSSSRAGATNEPMSGLPALISETETDQPLLPRMKSRVPSIGSTSQMRPLSMRTGSSAVSSDSHPAEGSRSVSSRLRNLSTARSAAETGEPGTFSQLSTSLPRPGPRVIGDSPRFTDDFFKALAVDHRN